MQVLIKTTADAPGGEWIKNYQKTLKLQSILDWSLFLLDQKHHSRQLPMHLGGIFFFFHPGSILDWSIFFSRKTINNFWCIFVENKYASFILGWSIFLLEKKIIINNCRCILGGERIFANFILDWSSYNLSKSNYLDQKNETKVNSKQLPMHLGGEQIC